MFLTILLLHILSEFHLNSYICHSIILQLNYSEFKDAVFLGFEDENQLKELGSIVNNPSN